MGVWQQALVIGYYQTYEEDIHKEKEAMLGSGARMPTIPKKRRR